MFFFPLSAVRLETNESRASLYCAHLTADGTKLMASLSKKQLERLALVREGKVVTRTQTHTHRSQRHTCHTLSHTFSNTFALVPALPHSEDDRQVARPS